MDNIPYKNYNPNPDSIVGTFVCLTTSNLNAHQKVSPTSSMETRIIEP